MPVSRRITFFVPVMLLLIVYAGYKGYQYVHIGTGYMAKMMCSLVFISNMEHENIRSEDIYDPLLNYFSYEVDNAGKVVTASGPLGICERSAEFKTCRGAILTYDEDITIPPQDWSFCYDHEKRRDESQADWPEGDRVQTDSLPSEIDGKILKAIIDEAFSENDSGKLRRTRAVIVVHRGRIIAERYAPPFDAQTRFLGWSMTKSITSALVGILVGQGKLDLHVPADVPEWKNTGDPRRHITLEHLLRMTSGLEFDESYADPLSDVVRMLFGVPDTYAFAAAKSLEYPPGNHWSYASGTTNIIMGIIRRQFEQYQDYLSFPYAQLFHRVGMHSAILETDTHGTFVGSSFCYATARDWARFGLLYLQDGVWQGKRILSEGWVAYSFRRTRISEQGKYGAHFWRLPEGESVELDMPDDMYFAAGHDGQYVNIVPSRDLVVVRLGMTKDPDAWNQNEFLKKILDTIHR